MNNDEILWRHLRDLPYFRAMLRAVEDRFYQDIELAGPVLDIGCGDGQFASVAFKKPLDVGLDPWSEPLKETLSHGAYRMVVQAYGDQIPFPAGSFGSAISNSVLEHIPNVEKVINDVGRAVRPGGLFVFCVPNHRFIDQLWGTRFFNGLGMEGLGKRYSRFFNRIARHINLDEPAVWIKRAEAAGFKVEQHWNYFPLAALTTLETGHLFGLPSLFTRKLFGKWILVQQRWNLAIPWQLSRKYLENPKTEEGVCTFFIARKQS